MKEASLERQIVYLLQGKTVAEAKKILITSLELIENESVISAGVVDSPLYKIQEM